MKTLLEPKEVLHLKELGVEFEDTACQWIFVPNFADDWMLESSRSAEYYHALPQEEQGGILPAPCLSEVLKKLPVCINVHNKYPSLQPYECDTFFFLIFDGVEYVIGYRQLGEGYEIAFSGSNFIEIAYQSLKYLAKNNYLKKDVGNV